jgi:hypothetical protein
MKAFTVQIPKSEAAFFLELMLKLGFDVTENLGFDFSATQQELILSRIADAKEDKMLDWETVQDDFVYAK